jgi:hypothetical protein
MLSGDLLNHEKPEIVGVNNVCHVNVDASETKIKHLCRNLIISVLKLALILDESGIGRGMCHLGHSLEHKRRAIRVFNRVRNGK